MSTQEKLKDAGHAVADAAKAVGQNIAKGAEKAVDFVKDKTGLGAAKDQGLSAIKEHMPVYASCGTKIGAVDKVEGDSIKLTAKDSKDGQHHWIPTSWVARVDSHVHLNRNSAECDAAIKKSGTCGC